MKRTMDVILAAVGFLLVAILVAITIKYFNRGKDVVEKNAEGALSAAESVVLADFEKYDGQEVQGSTVISMIENLKASNSNVIIYVYTNGGKTVAQYTNAGAVPTVTPPSGAAEITTTPAPEAGKYTDTKSNTYINPRLTYKVTCHKTGSKAVEYVTVVQK